MCWGAMQNENELLKKLRDGKAVLGLNNMYPAAGIIEGMCRGWDFVWIDGQHGQHTQDSLLHAVRTADSMGVSSLVRVPGQAPDFLGVVSDMRPTGIIIPMIENEQEAKAVSQILHFPPIGRRSYGGRRVIDLGGREYYKERTLQVIAQIETPEAVERAGAVAEVEGIHALFFGPDDMRIRLGLPIDTPIDKSKQLLDAMHVVASAALKAGKHAACPVSTIAALKIAVDLGYRILALGSDIGFLRVAAFEKLNEARTVLNRR